MLRMCRTLRQHPDRGVEVDFGNDLLRWQACSDRQGSRTPSPEPMNQRELEPQRNRIGGKCDTERRVAFRRKCPVEGGTYVIDRACITLQPLCPGHCFPV